MSKRGLQIQKKASAPVVKALYDAQGRYVFVQIENDEFVRMDMHEETLHIGFEFTTLLDGLRYVGTMGTERHIKAFAQETQGEFLHLAARMRNLIARVGGSAAEDDPSYQNTLKVTLEAEEAIKQALKGEYASFRQVSQKAAASNSDLLNLLGGIKTRGREKDQALTWLVEHSDHLRTRHRRVIGKDQLWADTLVELSNLLDREPRFDTAGHPKPWVAQAQGDVIAAMGSDQARHTFVHRLKEARNRRKRRGA